MSLTRMILMCGMLSIGLAGCGGSKELGPAATTPKVDPKVLEDKRRESMEKGKLQNAPAAMPPAAGVEK